jgi:hypothetical protein
MENQNEALDNELIEVNSDIEDQYIISVSKFILLSVISFGLYPLWWTYKAWRFYKQKEKTDIQPALRAIFGIFYLTSLFNKILYSAHEKNYTESYSSGALFAGYFILNVLARLPDPFWMISLLSFAFFILPFKALNFTKLNSSDLTVIEQDSFSAKQITLIVFGSLFWILVIYGMTKS